MKDSFCPVGLLLQLFPQSLHVLGGHLFGRHEGEGFGANASVNNVVAKFGILRVAKIEDSRPDGTAVLLSGVAFR